VAAVSSTDSAVDRQDSFRPDPQTILWLLRSAQASSNESAVAPVNNRLTPRAKPDFTRTHLRRLLEIMVAPDSPDVQQADRDAATGEVLRRLRAGSRECDLISGRGCGI